MKILFLFINQLVRKKRFVLFFVLVSFVINVNAQIIISNHLILPQLPNSSCNTAFDPNVIVGEDAIISNFSDPIIDPFSQVSDCNSVIYEWQSCPNSTFLPLASISVALAATRDYDPGPVTVTTYFRRLSTFTCNEPSLQTATVEHKISITIYPFSVGGIASSAQLICSGSSPAALTLSGHTGVISKWQKSSDATSFVNIPLTASSTLSSIKIGNITQDTWFRAEVKSGDCPAVYSNPVKISVYAPLAGSHNPVARNECPGYKPNVLSLTAEISGGKTPYTYQWRLNGTNIPTETAETFDPPVLTTKGIYSFDCVVSDACGTSFTTIPKVITIDIEKPTFTPPALNAGYCVEEISVAVYNNGAENTTVGPDYYLFAASSPILDIVASDNCSLAANAISWTIHFADTTPDLTGTRQLSAYVPVFPLTGIHFPVGTNTITYTVTDQSGNVSFPQTANLKVTPRPEIVKTF